MCSSSTLISLGKEGVLFFYLKEDALSLLSEVLKVHELHLLRREVVVVVDVEHVASLFLETDRSVHESLQPPIYN